MKLLLCIFVGFFAAVPARAHVDIFGQEGHGGDIAASLFLGIAYKSLYCFKNFSANEPPTENFISNLESAIQMTKVYSAQTTQLNGEEVDAINYPSPDEPKIIVNRTRWLDESLSDVMRSRLVIHEYLSIMNLDDSHYLLSYPLVEKNKKCLAQINQLIIFKNQNFQGGNK